MFKALIQRFLPRQEEGAQARQALMESMRSTRGALSRAYDGFNRADDDELIEAYVYEINALQHRYAYLLRQVRQLDGAGVGAP